MEKAQNFTIRTKNRNFGLSRTQGTQSSNISSRYESRNSAQKAGLLRFKEEDLLFPELFETRILA